MDTITSRTNPLCVHLRRLASSGAYRKEKGEFLCDSPKLLREAVRWNAEIGAVLYTEGAELPALPETVRAVPVSESVMKSVSPMETPQGVVFTCRVNDSAPPESLAPGRYLALDGVQDPGNVGTILRTADAFRWPVFLLPGCADYYNPKTLRAGMGVHFRTRPWRCTLAALGALAKKAGLPVYASALREKTADVRETDLTRCVLIVGSEGRGVSREALELCDRTVKIPMSPHCESLNAAAAAAVLLWEAARTDAAGSG